MSRRISSRDLRSALARESTAASLVDRARATAVGEIAVRTPPCRGVGAPALDQPLAQLAGESLGVIVGAWPYMDEAATARPAR